MFRALPESGFVLEMGSYVCAKFSCSIICSKTTTTCKPGEVLPPYEVGATQKKPIDDIFHNHNVSGDNVSDIEHHTFNYNP